MTQHILGFRTFALCLSFVGFALGACSDDASGDGDTAVGDTAGDTVAADTAGGDTTGGDASDTADTGADTGLATDTAADTTPDTTLPDPGVTPVFANCSPPGGDRNIYDIQDPQCPDHISPEPVGTPGFYVELNGVVVTGVYGDTLFVQEAHSGPYSGLTIFAHEIFTGDFAVGDVVNVTGEYAEFFENSQLFLQTITKTGTTHEPPAYVPTHPAHLSTTGAVAEYFEGVLVRVENVQTINTRPDCPLEYGEFAVTGNLRIDDMGIHWDARLGDHFNSITGPLIYSFGNFKIEPRTEADLNWETKGSSTGISKCLAEECHEPEDTLGTRTVVISEMMPDPAGSDLNQEWFELHNTTAQPIDVNNWVVRDCGDQLLTLSGPDLTIPPRGFLVVGMNGNENTNGGVPVDMAYGQGFYMPNTIGAILLYDGGGLDAQFIDQVRFSRFDPWDSMRSGRSMERIEVLDNGTDPDNWAAGTRSFGPADQKGTPGRENSASQ